MSNSTSVTIISENFKNKTTRSIKIIQLVLFVHKLYLEMDFEYPNEKNYRCRACLTESDVEMKSLTNDRISFCDQSRSKIEFMDLFEMYKECTGIEPNSQWNSICENCVQKLIDFTEFREMCRISFIYLTEIKEDATTAEHKPIIEFIEVNPRSELPLNCDDEQNDTSPEAVVRKPCTRGQTKVAANDNKTIQAENNTKDDQWKCDQCDCKFVDYSTLLWKFIHGKGTVACSCSSSRPTPGASKVCEQCGKIFKSNTARLKHSYTHTKVTPFKCHYEECGKMFPTNCKLKEHLLRHQGIKNFICPTCGLRKTTGYELRQHMKYHDPDLKFPCEICSQVFTRLMNMKRHMKVVHCGIKSHLCTHCGRSFAKLETLKHHVMTHTGEKPLACTICDKRFIQPVSLKTHMKTHDKKSK